MTWSKCPRCSTGDGMMGTADCSVPVIERVLLSGRAFNKLSVFGEFVAEINLLLKSPRAIN